MSQGKGSEASFVKRLSHWFKKFTLPLHFAETVVFALTLALTKVKFFMV